ncbi:MAG: DnaA/Hda family protein [Pseudomonadota bacterium]
MSLSENAHSHPQAGAERVQGPEIWSRAKQSLRRDLSGDEFVKWIEDVRFVADFDGQMLLAVRDRYNYARICADYRRPIVRAWRTVDPERRTPRIECWATAPDNLRDLIDDPWAQPAEEIDSEAKGGDDQSNPMRFDTLVVGESNAAAVKTARRIAAGEPVHAQTIIISGPQGVGKTHTLKALQYETALRGGAKAVHISAEEFRAAYCDGAKKRDTSDLKARVRSCGLLLIDDIQIIASSGTDNEFRATLRSITSKGGLVVLTSDAAPGDLKQLSAQTREDLTGATTIEIGLPDEQMRAEIVARHADLVTAANPDFVLSEELRDHIVKRVRGPGRALCGAIWSLYTDCEFGERAPTVDMLDKIVRRQEGEAKPPTIEMIKRAAMRVCGLSKAEIESPCKERSISFPRQIAMYLCREMTPKSYPQIGRSFGKRDHTTVLYAYRKIKKLIANDAETFELVERVRETVREIQIGADA